ncbi:septum formation initiator precursor [Rhodobacter veldkampii DSM 11550]|uniref:Septum formation initiator n=1 Tax=Phaeovulum veldkampii DSM 11550 TaxID=1185920 RepID=A0A2T4JMX6_9RHOB|nr:septum formation initiator family protein [Phaeovulum veldkampii]MBK5947406.1 septum formation initiator precursor [Phaeovulum veldkampii DSM 11550]NCU21180.1 septum formation initiator family protein [Candidatus Falkowbacteria bacterium]PTE19269.1 septum formation initiator precursor [Phaeovulum veldkampii DSM 11550]TDQ62246.1 cell division protein FtsB [Phaeovulum veldkampii DSM 11550]
MTRNRPAFGPVIIVGLALLAGSYFTFAAVQGSSGVFRRVEIEAEIAALERERAALQAEVERMTNLTHRLSDEYLDLDLLDERAREVLGTIRADEIVIR